MKKGDIIIHFDWFDLFEESELTKEEQTEMIFAAIDYLRLEKTPKFKDRAMKAIWKVIRERIDADFDKYEKKAAANRKNGQLGGRPKASEEDEKNPLGYLGFNEKPKKPVTVTVTSVTDSVTGSVCRVTDAPDGACDSDGDTHTRQEVRTFFADNQFTSDPDKFIDYNIGKDNGDIFLNPKRWQAVARNWEKNEASMHPPDSSAINWEAI